MLSASICMLHSPAMSTLNCLLVALLSPALSGCSVLAILTCFPIDVDHFMKVLAAPQGLVDADNGHQVKI